MISLNKDYEDGLEFELTSDDYGSISDTGYYSWNDSIDVHNYQGRYLTLRFYVPKYSDSGVYATKSLIIDNVKIDGTPTPTDDSNQDDKEYLTWPTDSTQIIAHNDETHQGIDTQGNQGDEAYAAADGKVVFAGQQDGYDGKVVIINSEYQGKNIQTRYSNLQSLSVATGDYVFEGDSLGAIGGTNSNSGSSTVLHFEVLESTDGNECAKDNSNTQNVDPEDYLYPYNQIEAIVPDDNLDTMGGSSTSNGLKPGYAYLDNILKNYRKGDFIIKYYRGNNEVTKDDKNITSVTIQIKVITYKPVYKSTFKTLTFRVNATKYNRAMLIEGKGVAINIDDFNNYIYSSDVLKYSGKIDLTKKLNTVNQSIKEVQKKLKNLNYDTNLNPSGIIDEPTLNAVEKFKEVNHLSNDNNYGIINQKTWEILFNCTTPYKEKDSNISNLPGWATNLINKYNDDYNAAKSKDNDKDMKQAIENINAVKRLETSGYSKRRIKATYYAMKYAFVTTPHDDYQEIIAYTWKNLYLGKVEDCANFVSYCLYKSGFKMNEQWYFYITRLEPAGIDELKYSPAWATPAELHSYLASSGNIVYRVRSKAAISDLAKTGQIKPGDVAMLWDSHAIIITDVDTVNGMIYYSAHNESRLNLDLCYAYDANNNDTKAWITIISVNY